MKKEIVDTVLKKFMTAPRTPKYLLKKEYAHLQEPNKEIYLSSAYYKHDWSWDKCKAFFKNMLRKKGYFVCSLPYQIAIKEGLLMRRQVEEEMSEDDFDEISFLLVKLKFGERYYSTVYSLRLGFVGNDE